jgi:hypothetical protein
LCAQSFDWLTVIEVLPVYAREMEVGKFLRVLGNAQPHRVGCKCATWRKNLRIYLVTQDIMSNQDTWK